MRKYFRPSTAVIWNESALESAGIWDLPTQLQHRGVLGNEYVVLLILLVQNQIISNKCIQQYFWVADKRLKLCSLLIDVQTPGSWGHISSESIGLRQAQDIFWLLAS